MNQEVLAERYVQRIGVYGVAIQDGQMLLTTKGPKGCYRGLLDLPGGGIEFGESAQDTLKREFAEEVGMTFESMELLDNFSHTQHVTGVGDPFHFHHLGQVYIVTGVVPIPNQAGEDIFDWYPVKRLTPEMLTPFARKAFVALIK
jgi:8-oxo-dGTP diphosphatase